ncbi:MAG: flagellar type III secretion system pore protein FliP [Deltaproteobacteria bacterium]|nr:flagellar type III secretion system pore protein FliP [Deltaproteobacteria bacterium]
MILSTRQKFWGALGLLLLGFCFNSSSLFAASTLPPINFSLSNPAGGTDVASAMKIFLFMTLLSIGPALLLTMTSFTRIIIVLSFLRQAIGVQQSPPNQVLVGLSLFLTFFIMNPVIQRVYQDSITPFMEGKIDQETALKKGAEPLKKFMFAQTRRSDLELLINLSKTEVPQNLESLSMAVLIPSFVLSELKTAFQIGFLIYLPFVLIDLVISMVLLVMGMMVLPPVVISMPFKLMLFVLVDGWDLIVGSLMRSFR